MYKIAVIGGNDTVIGFKALGLDTFPVSDTNEAKSALRSLTSSGENYAIIYIEENFYIELSDEIDRFKDRATPAIILIPGRGGSTGHGLSALQSAVERAVGADIL